MNSHYFQKAFFNSAILLFIIACHRDNDTDTTSPCYRIRESEKLVLPGGIALPHNLPAGNTRVATYYAEGVQKYKAQLKAGSTTGYEWVFVAPHADLYDAANRKIGTHGAGPFWQLSAADSIFGQAYDPPKAAASSDASSIDWLLLLPKTGKAPTGIFTTVSYIQRIATIGGKAPATPPASASETVDVKYTAVYRFTCKNP